MKNKWKYIGRESQKEMLSWFPDTEEKGHVEKNGFVYFKHCRQS